MEEDLIYHECNVRIVMRSAILSKPATSHSISNEWRIRSWQRRSDDSNVRNELASSMPSLSLEEWHIYNAQCSVKAIKDKVRSLRACNR